MGTGAITQYVDVAQIVLYVFWVFFAGLIVYLVRENKREGYPLDTAHGKLDGWPPRPRPKTYLLGDGHVVHKPDDLPGSPPFSAEQLHPWDGSPIEPVGDPLVAGVGPGAWANRVDVAERTYDGAVKLQPLRALPGWSSSSKDPDARGMTVLGGDGEPAGTVVDLWADISEGLFRYLEVAVPVAHGGTRNVLLPINFARIGRRAVRVDALYGAQFAGVPAMRDPMQVTMLEEEKIQAYFGAGKLYAAPHRSEPLL